MDFPWPDKKLSPNARVHRMHLAKVKAKQRSDCFYIAKQEKPKFNGNIPITIIFHPPTKHKRDLDNCLASCKGMLDGIADAWGIDDARFRPITIDFGEVVKNGAVVITFNKKEGN